MTSMIERVARAMCIADGRDPDEEAWGGPNNFSEKASGFNGYMVAVCGKAWELYRRQANLLIAGSKEITAALGEPNQ